MAHNSRKITKFLHLPADCAGIVLPNFSMPQPLFRRELTQDNCGTPPRLPTTPVTTRFPALLSCNIAKLCVWEGDLGMMAFVAWFAP